ARHQAQPTRHGSGRPAEPGRRAGPGADRPSGVARGGLRQGGWVAPAPARAAGTGPPGPGPRPGWGGGAPGCPDARAARGGADRGFMIRCEHLTYVYGRGTPFEVPALTDVSLAISTGEVVGIIGATGSGKSTLVQHMNGLLRPTSGRVLLDDVDIHGPRVDRRRIRQQIGLLFQDPEQQLFEETVVADVAFGPRNLGLSDEDARVRARRALELVGLPPDRFGPRSPFELSGGEMRRAAIAGV